MGNNDNGDGNMDRAFNFGSDARLGGRTVFANPYYPNSLESIYWLRGWEDVHKHWGQEANWPVRRLPSIGGHKDCGLEGSVYSG
mgnify:CR=1 FL=1